MGRRAQRKLHSERFLSIHNRPDSANNRTRFGHWERDGMYAANLKQVLVCLDRKSRLIRLGKVEGRTARDFNNLTFDLLRKEKVLSITNDNGSEFRKSYEMSVPVYHCDPLRPDQRGSVESVIGTLRMLIKRNTDLDKIGKKGIKRIEKMINNRPRKIFNYKTPYEGHYGLKVALVS